jgi:hypothetical protein
MRDEIPETPVVSGIPLRSIPETTQQPKNFIELKKTLMNIPEPSQE